MDKLFLRGRQGFVHGKGYAKTSRRHEPECKWRPAAGRRRAERPNGPNQAAQAGFASRSISHWKANDEPPHLQGKASKNQAQLSRMGRPSTPSQGMHAKSHWNADGEPQHSQGEASKQAQSNRMGRPSAPSQEIHAQYRDETQRANRCIRTARRPSMLKPDCTGRPPYRRRKYTRNIALERRWRAAAFAGRGVQACSNRTARVSRPYRRRECMRNRAGTQIANHRICTARRPSRHNRTVWVGRPRRRRECMRNRAGTQIANHRICKARHPSRHNRTVWVGRPRRRRECMRNRAETQMASRRICGTERSNRSGLEYGPATPAHKAQRMRRRSLHVKTPSRTTQKQAHISGRSACLASLSALGLRKVRSPHA